MAESFTGEYFAGVMGAEGFVSRFRNWFDPRDLKRVFYLKGGPGTGKSTLLKGLAAHARRLGLDCLTFRCSSDPHSLDGVLVPKVGFGAVDATPPHSLECTLPGAVDELVDLGRCWDGALLRPLREEIAQLQARKAACYANARKYLATLRLVRLDGDGLVEEAFLTEKMAAAAQRTAVKWLPLQKGEGRVRPCFSAALTPQGPVELIQRALPPSTAVIQVADKRGTGFRFLQALVREGVRRGQDGVLFYDPLFPEERPAHLWFPRARVAFVSAPWEGEVAATVNMERFIRREGLAPHRARLAFDRRAEGEFTRGAVQELAAAHALHGELERLYVPAMDFQAVAEEGRLLEKILSDMAG